MWVFLWDGVGSHTCQLVMLWATCTAISQHSMHPYTTCNATHTHTPPPPTPRYKDLSVKSEEDLDKAVSDMEARISQETMTLNEEKALMNSVRKLR